MCELGCSDEQAGCLLVFKELLNRSCMQLDVRDVQLLEVLDLKTAGIKVIDAEFDASAGEFVELTDQDVCVGTEENS